MQKLQFVEGEVVPRGEQGVRVVMGCGWTESDFARGGR